MAEYALSFHDLNLVDGFKEAVETQNKKVFEAILFTNGMDVSLGYEIVACKHRTLNKIEYNGFRVEGLERIDEAWLATGCASMDARIEACRDPHLRHELRKLKYEGTVDRLIKD